MAIYILVPHLISRNDRNPDTKREMVSVIAATYLSTLEIEIFQKVKLVLIGLTDYWKARLYIHQFSWFLLGKFIFRASS